MVRHSKPASRWHSHGVSQLASYHTPDVTKSREETWNSGDPFCSGPEKGVIWLVEPTALNDRIVVKRSRFIYSTLPSDQWWGASLSDIWFPPLPPGLTSIQFSQMFEHEVGRGKPFQIPLFGIFIRKTTKGKIRELLKSHFGVDQASIFPDVGSLAKTVAELDHY